MTESTALTALCARTLDNLKAENVIALDLRDVDSSPADYFVICTANSDTHARALTDALARVTLSVGERRPRTEGRDTGEWVLLDYFDVVVHVFRTTAREYYKLEKLWGDAPAVTLKKLEEQSKEEKAKSKEEKPKAAKLKTVKATAAKKASTEKAGAEKTSTEKASTEKAPAKKSATAKATTKAPTKVPKEVAAEKPVKKTTVTAKKSVQAADAASAEAPKAKRSVVKVDGESKAPTAKAKSATKASTTKTESPKKVSVKKVSTKKVSEE
jgi:ribosome-associated protein